MIQEILVGLIFIAALIYVGRILLANTTAKDGCAKGCGSCAASDKKLAKTEHQPPMLHTSAKNENSVPSS